MRTLLTSLLLLTVPYLHAEELAIDNAHAAITFSVSHLVVSRTHGSFNTFEGSLNVVDGHLKGAKAVIQVASIDTKNERRDGHLRSADFFDAETFPTITFEGTKFENGKLTGNLTIKGVTREVVLDAQFVGPVKNFQNQDVYGLTAATTIDRTQFGLTWSKTTEAGGLVVGNDVDIRISVEAVSP